MRKEYKEPTITIENIVNNDVIAVSGGLVTTNFGITKGAQGDASVNF